ncbi:MAG: glycosyl transferase [Desulfobacterales bacterium SG8_35_2]|nr:MAG: glycosyl transferase [Desulfobacterales bacterium SG8_35_2]
MIIVQLVPELQEGGVERGTVELSREFVLKGHKSFVISRGGTLVQEIEKHGGHHITLDLCSKNIATVPFRAVRLRSVLRKIQPDIIHARSRVPAWLAYFANRKLLLPFVTTVHGIYSVNPYSKIMTKGDAVICISEVLRDYARSNYGTDLEKITVIQRGVDLEYFNPDRLDHDFMANFKTKFNLWNNYIVTSVGRITYLKDYETFIEAVSIAKEHIPTIKGVIVGGASGDKKDYLGSLKRLAENLEIAENILFVGSQAKMPEIYALSDLTVNASLTMGNVGRTVVESLAMDRPVIATSYEGLVNLVQDGLNGFIIETKNPHDLADKIRRAKQTVFRDIRKRLNPEYTLQTMVKKTLAVYRQLLKEPDFK